MLLVSTAEMLRIFESEDRGRLLMKMLTKALSKAVVWGFSQKDCQRRFLTSTTVESANGE